MKKILSLFLLSIFCLNIFACLIDSIGVRKLVINKVVTRWPNMSSATQQQVATNLINNSTTLSTNTNLSNQSINTITNGIINNAPERVLTNAATMQNTTTAITNAANNASAVGFNDLQVTNVAGSGTDGIYLTMQQTNASGGTYTVQVDTSSTTPQNATTVTADSSSQLQLARELNNVIYHPSTIVTLSTSPTTNEIGQVVRLFSRGVLPRIEYVSSDNATDLTTGQASQGISSTTGGSAIVSHQIVDTNGNSSFTTSNVQVNQNTTTTYSANPTVTTQSTVSFSLPNGTTRNVTAAAGAMQVVQKTTTNIIRANGTTVSFDTIGQPIVNMNLTTENVKRIVVNNQVLQGRQITIGTIVGGENAYYAIIDGNRVQFNHTPTEITNHTVYVMNGVPSVHQVQSGDQTGSTNACTYYVNGVDTGVTANMAIMTTVTLANTNSTITGTVITTRQVNGTTYYVVDDVLTDNVYNQNDRTVTTYRPIDDVSMNTRNVQTITNVVVKNSNGQTLLTSNNLGQQVVQSVRFANGQTITGTIGKTNATKITYNGNQYVGVSVTSQNGVLFLDGQSTGVPVNGENINTESVRLYVVDGRTTNHVVNSSDVESSTTYYTDNGSLTNVVVDPSNQITSNTTRNNTSNTSSEQVYTIRTNDGQTYKARSINQINSGTVIRDTSGNTVISGNNISTTSRTVLYHVNGTKLGLNSNAQYISTEAGTTGKVLSATVERYYDTNLTFTNNYYLPKYNGAYFVVDGKLIQNNKNGSVVQVNNDKTNYVAVQQPVWADYQYVDRWYPIEHEKPITNFQTQKLTSYTSFSDVVMLPTSFGTKSNVRCISCGNQLLSGRTDGAGSHSWNGIAVSISNGSLYNFSGTTIDNSRVWKQVQKITDKYFVAMKSNGNLYLLYLPNYIAQGGSVSNLQLTTKFKTIASYYGGSYNVYGISTDNKLYRVYINPAQSALQISDLSISNVDKIVAGNTICVALDSTNHRVYVVDQDSYQVYNSTSNFNIRDIGVSRNEALIVGYQTVSAQNVVKINGNTYNASDVTTRTQTVYTRNGVGTDVIYDASHTRTQNQISYNFTDIDSNRDITLSLNHQISSVDYQNVTTTQSGSVSSIVTTVTNPTNGQKTYAINGCDTGIAFDVGTNIASTSRQVYYIGDVNTNIEVAPNDDLQLRGDYWMINGFNTQVRFYGLGQMAVRVADVTPGELDQNQQATGSTVVVPLSIKAQIVRFNQSRPITQIRLQFRRLTDNQWTNLKVLRNTNRKLQTRRLEAIFGRYVNVPVSKQQSFILRCNITDGTESTVTASALQPQQGNVFYWAFIRSNYDRPN